MLFLYWYAILMISYGKIIMVKKYKIIKIIDREMKVMGICVKM